MKILVSHPTGNANVRAVIQAFESHGSLAEFNTSISISPKANWLRLLPVSLRNELLRRKFPINQNLIHSFPVMEFGRLGFNKLGHKKMTQHEVGKFSVDSVYRSFDKKVSGRLENLVAKKHLSMVYAYEDGALETFKKAKTLGLTCAYDLPIAYWGKGRKLLLEEAERMPEWAVTLGGGINDSDSKLARKSEEMDLADVVVGPGKFVLDSIPPKNKQIPTIMSPFGSPISSAELESESRSYSDKSKPLKVLFVGSMGQRKGLGDLFKAFELLKGKNIELIVLGSLLQPLSFYQNKCDSFTHISNKPHHEVLELMRSCDVFCLPSIVEGRALVMQEAMSQGMPIIITPNTGGEDLVEEGDTGFLAPIRSPQLLAEKIEWFSNNRNELPRMGSNAKAKAKVYTWDSYGKNIINGLSELF